MKKKNFLPFFIFFLSLIIHLTGFNTIGRTWDEQFKVDLGYLALDRTFAGDFSLNAWNHGTEHPMVAKYIYGAALSPHLVRVDTIQSINELSTSDYIQITSKNTILTGIGSKVFAVPYDLTAPRLVSAIFNSLTVVFIFLITRKFFAERIALLAAIFLMLLPRFVVMGQLVTYESLSAFLFSFLTWFYLSRRKRPKTLFFIVLGISTGLLFWTRYSNYYVFIFLCGIVLYDIFYVKNKQMVSWKLILIPFVAFFLGIIIWPLTWHNFPHYVIESFQQNAARPIGPSLYYPVQLLITTPIPILIGAVIGIYYAITMRREGGLLFLWWFFSALFVMSMTSVAGGGTRYIFLIYPSFAALAAYGYKSFTTTPKKSSVIFAAIIFLTFELLRFSPYYLDYYNQLVGGPKGAAMKNLPFSWWGEGQREVGFWLNEHAKPNSTIALSVTPLYVFPNVRRDIELTTLEENPTPDYIVMSRNEFLQQFKNYKNTYTVVYQAEIDSTPLVVALEKQ